MSEAPGDAIFRDLAAAYEKALAATYQPHPRMLSPRCGLYDQHRRCHSAVCECDCHFPKETE